MEDTEQLKCGTNSQTSSFSVDTLSVPFIVDGILEQWPSREWTIDTLAQALGNKSFRCRLMQREREQRDGPAWEAEGVYVECQLHQFSSWCRGEGGDDNPFSPFSPCDFSGYIDYKYMIEVFADHPHMLKKVWWSSLGLADRDGKDSTIWIGSAGASTPCHYDTYGFNLVAQIQGRKRWVLFPPDQSCDLYPTRIPYEESSVFSQLDLISPDLDQFPRFRNARPIVITLEAGQVLYIPRHWWHYVTCLETAVSINTWVDVPEDRESRLQEAVTRLLASSLIPYLAQTVGTKEEDSWVNPTEELESATCNVQYLKAALSSVSPPLTPLLTKTSPHRQALAHPHNKERSTTQLPLPQGTQIEKPLDVLAKQNINCNSASDNGEYFSHVAADEEVEVEKLLDLVRPRENVAVLPVTGKAELWKPSIVSSNQSDADEETSENHVAVLPVTDKAELWKSSDVPTNQTVADEETSENHLSSHTAVSDTVAKEALIKSDMPSQKCTHRKPSVKSKEREACGYDIFHISANHRQVFKTLQGITVNTVESPFSASEFQERKPQPATSHLPTCHDPSAKETENQDTYTGSHKRKHLDSENFTDTENSDIKISPKRFCLSSQISIYAPRPCHLQCYMQLLQQEGSTESNVLSDEEVDKDKHNVSSCSMSKNCVRGQTSDIEERLLKSVLHPDVVKLIVSKLMEQV